MVICLERGADLHMAQMMPVPLTVSCFSKIQIAFLLPVHLGGPGKGPLNGCVCVTAVNNARLEDWSADQEEGSSLGSFNESLVQNSSRQARSQ